MQHRCQRTPGQSLPGAADGEPDDAFRWQFPARKQFLTGGTFKQNWLPAPSANAGTEGILHWAGIPAWAEASVYLQFGG